MASASGVVFQARNAGVLTNVPINYQILHNGEWARPRNIEVIARPDRWVVLRENGYVVAARQFTAAQMALGQISPKPAIFNRAQGRPAGCGYRRWA